MQLNKFKISSNRLEGYLVLTYENGYLKSVLNEFKSPLNPRQTTTINSLLAWRMIDLAPSQFADFGLKVEPIGMVHANQRVALFCEAYKAQTGNRYEVNKKEGGLLKSLALLNDDDFGQLVQAYFACNEWWANPKCIGGLVNRINEVRSFMKMPKDVPNKWNFPPVYSKTREQECKDNAELQAYWKHLRELGYVKTRIGIVETWIKQ